MKVKVTVVVNVTEEEKMTKSKYNKKMQEVATILKHSVGLDALSEGWVVDSFNCNSLDVYPSQSKTDAKPQSESKDNDVVAKDQIQKNTSGDVVPQTVPSEDSPKA